MFIIHGPCLNQTQPLRIISGVYEDHTWVIFSFFPVTRKWKSKQTTGSWVGPGNKTKSSLLWLSFTPTLLPGSNPSLSFLTDDKCTWMFDLYVDVHKQANMHTHVCNTIMLVWGSLRLIPIVNFIILASEIKMTYLGETETYQWWMLQDSPTPVVLSAHNGRETQKNI